MRNHGEAEFLGAQTVTYAAAGLAVVSSLSWQMVGVAVGAVIGVLGLCLQLWVALRNDKRAEAAHRSAMSAYQQTQERT